MSETVLDALSELGALSVSRRGIVRDFDVESGLGEIVADEHHFAFHCTAIADGTRDIAVGTAVSFVVVPAHHGRFEAGDIVAAKSDR